MAEDNVASAALAVQPFWFSPEEPRKWRELMWETFVLAHTSKYDFGSLHCVFLGRCFLWSNILCHSWYRVTWNIGTRWRFPAAMAIFASCVACIRVSKKSGVWFLHTASLPPTRSWISGTPCDSAAHPTRFGLGPARRSHYWRGMQAVCRLSCLHRRNGSSKVPISAKRSESSLGRQYGKTLSVGRDLRAEFCRWWHQLQLCAVAILQLDKHSHRRCRDQLQN